MIFGISLELKCCVQAIFYRSTLTLIPCSKPIFRAWLYLPHLFKKRKNSLIDTVNCTSLTSNWPHALQSARNFAFRLPRGTSARVDKLAHTRPRARALFLLWCASGRSKGFSVVERKLSKADTLSVIFPKITSVWEDTYCTYISSHSNQQFSDCLINSVGVFLPSGDLQSGSKSLVFVSATVALEAGLHYGQACRK